MRHGYRYRGFTLIELLVVVSIIVLLVSLLLPSMKKAKDYAVVAACKSNQKQLFMLLDFYSKDYNDQIPLGFAEDLPGRLWITDSFYVYQGREKQYIIWGRLFKGNYLKDGKVLAEPGGNLGGNPAWGYDKVNNPWPPDGHSRGNNRQRHTRSTYFLRPEMHWKQPDSFTTDDPHSEWWPHDDVDFDGDYKVMRMAKMRNFPRQALLTGHVRGSPPNGSQHRPGAIIVGNIVYGDGSLIEYGHNWFASNGMTRGSNRVEPNNGRQNQAERRFNVRASTTRLRNMAGRENLRKDIDGQGVYLMWTMFDDFYGRAR